ncbi:MAG: helix-turn-helix transcriptional regulator [Nitrospirae bacterium]|nr:helix-turn-helix transcriptional regulator [Candidatus Manganitrophaceae bacterium]
MANGLNQVSKNLALSIVTLRGKRGLTQAALARLADVPRSTVTHLESGAGNPSLINLVRIAAALRVSVEELLAAPRANCKLIRADEMPARRSRQGVSAIYKLLPDAIPGMEMDRMEIALGGRIGGVPHVGGTKEYLTVVQSEITVHVAGEAFCVRSGDVLAFPGDQAHSYQNTGREKAVGFSVVVLAPVGV